MSETAFFEESKEQSIIKADIVCKYLWAWKNVIKGRVRSSGNKIGYIDLFAGPGRYKDGTKSTPLLILEKAVQDPEMRELLVTTFNDAENIFTSSLSEAIDALEGIETLKYKPEVSTSEIGEETAQQLADMNLIPCLSFLDPWGYKGLSCKLINSVIKDWACETIVFFNYNRINMGICNATVREHIDALFGEEKAEFLRKNADNMTPNLRERTILNSITEALIDMGVPMYYPSGFERSLEIEQAIILFLLLNTC